MKSLIAALTATLLLAGCGAQPAVPTRAAAPQALSAQAKRDQQQLYGIVVAGTVTHVRPSAGGRLVTVTLEIQQADDSFDGSRVTGKVRFNVTESLLNHGLDLAAIKVGTRLQAFVDYPLIDGATHTIVAQPHPYTAHNVSIVARK